MKRLIIHTMMLLCAAPLLAQSDTTGVPNVVAGTLKIEQGTQKKLDAWGVERAEREARYAALKANVLYLMDRKATDERQVTELQENIAELRRRLAESKRFETVLRDSVLAIERRLETSIRGGLPFLTAEREKRLASLNAELARPDASPAELLRRLLEALQYEAAYGGTADVTAEKLAIGAESVSANVLRIGRFALFWRSIDGKRAGRYDMTARGWIELPRRYGPEIRRAIEMASHLRPAGIVELPVGRIKP